MSSLDPRLVEAMRGLEVAAVEAGAREAELVSAQAGRERSVLGPGLADERHAATRLAVAQEKHARAREALLDIVALLCAEAEQRAEARLRLP